MESYLAESRKEEIEKWLDECISSIFSVLCSAFLYGSFIRSTTAFNDCDLALISKYCPRDHEWQKIKKIKKTMTSRFRMAFGIELSIAIYSESEWDECSPHLNGAKKQIGLTSRWTSTDLATLNL